MSVHKSEPSCSDVSPIRNLSETTACLDVLILAAGFEDRAYRTLPGGEFSVEAHCVLIRFRSNVPDNDTVFKKFHEVAIQKFTQSRLHIVELRHSEPQRFEPDLGAIVSFLPKELRRIGIDISGMPSHAICTALKVVRDHRAEESIVVLYTAAEEYVPSRAEYDELTKRYPDEIELLPKSMALEMDENLILDTFSGYRSQNAKACLAVFAGYEAHRSTGVIEAVNPALLLLLYGKPGDERLAWRLQLSQKLHRKFEKGRRTATEIVSTLHVRESLDVLEKYYDFLIDDYALVVSPIGSKMHVVASYLFWEKYGEVQLTFPIPIGYDPKNAPKGVGTTYAVTLEPRRRLFRTASEPMRSSPE